MFPEIVVSTDDVNVLRRRLQWALRRLYFAEILIPGTEEEDPPWIVIDALGDELDGEGGNTPLEAVDSACEDYEKGVEEWWKDDEAEADIKVTVTLEFFAYEQWPKSDGELIEKARSHGRIISQNVDREYGTRMEIE